MGIFFIYLFFFPSLEPLHVNSACIAQQTPAFPLRAAAARTEAGSWRLQRRDGESAEASSENAPCAALLAAGFHVEGT